MVPWGFRKLLLWVKDHYDNPVVYVTENGFSDEGELRDLGRIDYYQVRGRAGGHSLPTGTLLAFWFYPG